MMSFRSARSWCWEYRTFRLPDLWALWVRGGGRRQNLRGPNTPPNRQPFASSNLILRHFQHHTGFAASRNDFCDTLEIAISRRIHADLHLTNVQKPTCPSQAFRSLDAMAVPGASRVSRLTASRFLFVKSCKYYFSLFLLYPSVACFLFLKSQHNARLPLMISCIKRIALLAMSLFNPKHIPEYSKVPCFTQKKNRPCLALSQVETGQPSKVA
ncbi:hypothetical protein GGI42DRAFT_48390 [Trichoderma sp. SZMC 28013]